MGGGNASFWLRLSASPHLVIVRDALTLTFPVIIAGAFAVLVNNFPVPSYQRFMEWFFGPNWKILGAYMWGGTFAIIAPVTVCAIGYGVCNLYNKKHSLDTIHPLIVGLISFCSLMVLIEPLSEVFAIPYRWVGIHGLFLAIIVALISSELFLWFYKHNVRINFFLETPNAIMVNAFSSLLPGAMTIFVFAGFKAVMSYFKLNDLHELTYEMLCKPFVGMGNNLPSALVFMFARQFLWFLGIHGSNALEPVMTELYSSSSAANAIAMASGGAPPFVFTKTFFDSYVTMGGSGNTLSLLFAFFIARRWKKPGTVAKISILPAIFNINETLVFGVPIVLNPFYFVPFVATPMALTVTSYLAMRAGLVSVTMTEAAWTTPALVSGYVAAGNLT
ncbi:MAG: PTS transporter subunit EIIC, partial [Synergistaceae bacterium]|nr:PTS transporter subunit EIIC [Synergistaceae bacterium]